MALKTTARRPLVWRMKILLAKESCKTLSLVATHKNLPEIPRQVEEISAENNEKCLQVSTLSSEISHILHRASDNNEGNKKRAGVGTRTLNHFKSFCVLNFLVKISLREYATR